MVDVNLHKTKYIQHINMTHRGVAVSVIQGLLDFQTVTVFYYSTTPTHNLLIISDVFSGNLKEELGPVL